MRKFLGHPASTFVLFIAWKVLLFAFTTQPIPSNDAYFYDGAVVNSLRGGEFVNPTVALGRPYSGTVYFSPYPPLYQAVLWTWMRLFGSSVVAAISLHLTLLTLFTVLLYRVLRRLETPPWVMHLAGGCLFVITFHDRPDTLGHVLGIASVASGLAWVQTGKALPHLGLSAAWLALGFATSVQLGATYTAVVGATVLARARLFATRIPWLALAGMVVIPVVLLAIGKFGFPRWWIGFQENAHNNPSTVGLHVPDLDSLLKLTRSLPALLATFALAAWGLPQMLRARPVAGRTPLTIFLGASTGALGVIVLGLSYLSPNYVPAFGAYLQPLVVGAGLTWLLQTSRLPLSRNFVIVAGSLCVALGAIRAVGMSTWGVLCARDVSYGNACERVAREVTAGAQDGKTPVVLSAAYLYAAARPELKLIHSDYLVELRGRATESDLTGLLRLQPCRLILTQFDYYRRYEAVVAELQRTRADVSVRITNTARVAAPDARRATRKVVQHISWAPVIVEISWPPVAESK
jgi:hypothetical protein